MSPLLKKIKPKRGYSYVFYVTLNILLPILVFLLVKTSFIIPALFVILLSKWRMFAVRPRFWWANIRTNAVDITFGLSMLAFMVSYPHDLAQLAFVVIWALWLIVLKPKVSVLAVSMQAFLGFIAGLMAIFSAGPRLPLYALVLIVGLICFFSAHHFLYSFDESHTALLSYLWGYFGAALMWVLGHWLIFYWVVAQPALLLISLSFILGTMYYLDHFEKLTAVIRKQLLLIAVITILIVWSALVYFHWFGSNGIIV